MTGNKLFYYAFGSALVITGIVLLSGGELYLPTRHPPRQIHLSGASFLLFGFSPLLLGLANLLIGQDEERRNSFIVQLLIGISILAMIAALLLAGRA